MRGDHPDREWLRAVGKDLDLWLAEQSDSPTSQLTGGGAVAHGEHLLSALHGGHPTLLMPSATYALWVALRVMGVRAGDEVLIPQYDWTSSLAVVLALGAVPVVSPVDPNTLTIDPHEAAALRTQRTRALVAGHVLGIPADIPALRQALPSLPLIEDCAQAFGSTLDGIPVGSLGDAAVFSFGPGKAIDVGELGALIVRDEELHASAVRESAHPIRQRLSGVSAAGAVGFSLRPHPLAAVLLCSALRSDAGRDNREDRVRAHTVLELRNRPLRPYGLDPRRTNASPYIPFDPDSLTDVSLEQYVSYRELADIESIRAGRPTHRRVGAFRVTERAAESQRTDDHSRSRHDDHSADHPGCDCLADPLVASRSLRGVTETHERR